MADEITDVEPRRAVARRGSFVQTVRAVAWSFFGVRKSSDHELDVSRLNPVHVVIAGVIGAALFVALLLLVVGGVVGSASGPGGAN